MSWAFKAFSLPGGAACLHPPGARGAITVSTAKDAPVLLRQLADRLGLTAGLDRALTIAIADIAVLDQLTPVLGAAPSGSTVTI